MGGEYKVVVLGKEVTGKSQLVRALKKEVFQEVSELELGASSHKIIDPQKNITLTIWDTKGDARYAVLLKMYYLNAQVALLLIDSVNLDSVDRAKKLYLELRGQASPDLKIMLVFTKVDELYLTSKMRERQAVSARVDELFPQDDPQLTYHHVSSKSGKGIKELRTLLFTKCNESSVLETSVDAMRSVLERYADFSIKARLFHPNRSWVFQVRSILQSSRHYGTPQELYDAVHSVTQDRKATGTLEGIMKRFRDTYGCMSEEIPLSDFTHS
jgi:small GTP-binding protein